MTPEGLDAELVAEWDRYVAGHRAEFDELYRQALREAAKLAADGETFRAAEMRRAIERERVCLDVLLEPPEPNPAPSARLVGYSPARRKLSDVCSRAA